MFTHSNYKIINNKTKRELQYCRQMQKQPKRQYSDFDFFAYIASREASLAISDKKIYSRENVFLIYSYT